MRELIIFIGLWLMAIGVIPEIKRYTKVKVVVLGLTIIIVTMLLTAKPE